MIGTIPLRSNGLCETANNVNLEHFWTFSAFLATHFSSMASSFYANQNLFIPRKLKGIILLKRPKAGKNYWQSWFFRKSVFNLQKVAIFPNGFMAYIPFISKQIATFWDFGLCKLVVSMLCYTWLQFIWAPLYIAAKLLYWPSYFGYTLLVSRWMAPYTITDQPFCNWTLLDFSCLFLFI